MNTLPPCYKAQDPVMLLLLTKARQIDPGQDQAYMPLPNTTVEEALNHLRTRGYLLVQGGRIQWFGLSKTLTAHVFGRDNHPTLSWVQVRQLVKANYTSPGRPFQPARQSMLDIISEDERPTHPCLPAFPKLQAGYAFCAHVPNTTDIDLIGNDNWETVMLGREDLGVYVGQTYIDEVYCHVWWCEKEDCFLAQTA